MVTLCVAQKSFAQFIEIGTETFLAKHLVPERLINLLQRIRNLQHGLSGPRPNDSYAPTYFSWIVLPLSAVNRSCVSINLAALLEPS